MKKSDKEELNFNEELQALVFKHKISAFIVSYRDPVSDNYIDGSVGKLSDLAYLLSCLQASHIEQVLKNRK